MWEEQQRQDMSTNGLPDRNMPPLTSGLTLKKKKKTYDIMTQWFSRSESACLWAQSCNIP